MTEESDDSRAYLMLATAATPGTATPDAKARLMSAIERERYLPFLGELRASFDLSETEMRALLLKIDDPRWWKLDAPPIQGHMDFKPGPRHAPLRGGFARMQGGLRIPQHRHADRELTMVLEGELIDGDGNRYGPGSSIDMPPGSSHSLAVPEGKEAVVALLHGRIEML
jgi:Cupin domain